jgi:hypothetical protein
VVKVEIRKSEEGSLRAYMKRKYGNNAFEKNGDIKLMYLRLMLKNADEKTKKRIILALNFRKMRGRK